MSITAAEDDRETFATILESKTENQLRTVAAISQSQSGMTLDLKEQNDAFKKLHEKSDAILDHNRVASKKLDVQDKTMKDIQSDMTQANEKVCSFLAKSNTANPESSEISDADTPVLDFAIKILKKIISDTMTGLSLALLFSNAYNMSVDSQKHIQMFGRSTSANDMHKYDCTARILREICIPSIIPHAKVRRPRTFRESEPETAQSFSADLPVVNRVDRIAHVDDDKWDKVWADRVKVPRTGNRQRAEAACQMPSDLSFLVVYDPLYPDYTVCQSSAHPLHHWTPPSKPEAYFRTIGSMYRWEGGRIAKIPENDPIRRERLGQYSSATVFTQEPDTDHLLAKNFNAQTKSLARESAVWKVLRFNHIARDGQSTYSSVNLFGAQPQLAAPGSFSWLPQLLPAIYDFYEVTNEGGRRPPTTVSAGLIGSLPLLLAMAAFSAPAHSLAHALDCIQPGIWRPHGLPSGRSRFYLPQNLTNPFVNHLKILESEA